MGAFGLDTTSNATDRKQSGGDNANQQQGNGQITEAGGLSLAGRARHNTGISLEKGNLNTGVSVAGKGSLNTGISNSKLDSSTLAKLTNNKGTINIDNGGSALGDLAARALDTIRSLGSGGTSQPAAAPVTPVSVSVQPSSSPPSQDSLSGYVQASLARAGLGGSSSDQGTSISASLKSNWLRYGLIAGGVAVAAWLLFKFKK